MDDASYFLVIRLGPKTSECEKNVTVMSTVTGCDVTNCNNISRVPQARLLASRGSVQIREASRSRVSTHTTRSTDHTRIQ